MNGSLLSVILSTYQQPRWLELALRGYLRQRDAGPFEIVIADDGSGPETAEVVRRFASAAPFAVKHVWQEDRGFRKCAALNLAIRAAEGAYLVFSDGDCVPRADFLATHRALSRLGAYLSGGYCKLPAAASARIEEAAIDSGRAFTPAWLAANGAGRLSTLAKSLARPVRMDGLLNRAIPTRATFNGNNSSCWRRDAIAAGGFDERMGYGGEDREFGYRLVYGGIAPVRIRWSTLVLHLDHPRGWRNEQVRAANEAIIAETHAGRLRRTAHGIADAEPARSTLAGAAAR